MRQYLAKRFFVCFISVADIVVAVVANDFAILRSFLPLLCKIYHFMCHPFTVKNKYKFTPNLMES